MRFGWPRNNWVRGGLIGVGTILILAIIVSFFRDATPDETVSFGVLMDTVRTGDIERFEVKGTRVTAISATGDEVESRIGSNTDLALLLQNEDVGVGGSGVDVVYKGPSSAGNWFALAINLLYPLVIAVVIYFSVRRGITAGLRKQEPSEHALVQ